MKKDFEKKLLAKGYLTLHVLPFTFPYPGNLGSLTHYLFTQFRVFCANSVTTLQAIACTTDSHGFFDDMFAIEKALVYCCAASFTLQVFNTLFHHFGSGEELA